MQEADPHRHPSLLASVVPMAGVGIGGTDGCGIGGAACVAGLPDSYSQGESPVWSISGSVFGPDPVESDWHGHGRQCAGLRSLELGCQL